MNSNFYQLQHGFETPFLLQRKFYELLFCLNDVHLNSRELDLLAHINLKGTKKEFQRSFNCSAQQLSTMTKNLQTLGIITRDEDKNIIINPNLVPVQEDILLSIKLTNA